MFVYEEKRKSQGKEKVRSKHNEGNSVIQRVFTNAGHQGAITGNYQDAANYWANANARVAAFTANYAGDAGFTNPHMEQNMVDKSIKAKTTLAGESFETNEWAPLGNGNYYGPGSGWGIDIKEFINSQHPAAVGAVSGEVKNSGNANWRNMFWGWHGVWKAAYLEGAALADAQTPPNPNPAGQYYVYDKNNVGAGWFRCN